MRWSLAFSLALHSLWHRKGTLALVTLALTLSITLLIGVQYLRTEVKSSFTQTISGTDLIIGARSGQINLLLYSVFHIGNATNNIDWDTYQTLREDERIDWLLPISLGDSYRGHRVIGTSEDFPRHFRHGQDRHLELAEGRWFRDLFDVVLGSAVATEHRHGQGDEIILAHGGGKVSFTKHSNMPFRISGVLAPTGTPMDRAVFISLEGLEAIHIGWQSGAAIPGRSVSPDQARERELTPDSITAVFAGLQRPILTFQVQRAINQFSGEPLTAILPGVALSELWQVLGQFEKTLLAISGFVVFTSLIGVTAVLLALQKQRQREVAILRATGATPALIGSLYVIECVLLAVTACVTALALGALMLSSAQGWVLDEFSINLALRPLNATEWALIGAIPALALLVGLIPATGAWRNSRRPSFGALEDE
jgi:putative ABC transport system permease protein